jgi:hypothetical protein
LKERNVRKNGRKRRGGKRRKGWTERKVGRAMNDKDK